MGMRNRPVAVYGSITLRIRRRFSEFRDIAQAGGLKMCTTELKLCSCGCGSSCHDAVNGCLGPSARTTVNGRVARTSPDDSAYVTDEEADSRLDAGEKTPMRFPVGRHRRYGISLRTSSSSTSILFSNCRHQRFDLWKNGSEHRVKVPVQSSPTLSTRNHPRHVRKYFVRVSVRKWSIP